MVSHFGRCFHTPRHSGNFASRILALNLLALVALVGGLLFLNQFREGLLEARIEALLIEGRIIAGALGESAVDRDSEIIALDSETVRQIVRRTSEPTDARARIFNADGVLLADTRTLSEAGREVLTLRRREIANESKRLLQEIMDGFGSGIEIVTVELQSVNPPQEVRSSFNDVNRGTVGAGQSVALLILSYCHWPREMFHPL